MLRDRKQASFFTFLPFLRFYMWIIVFFNGVVFFDSNDDFLTFKSMQYMICYQQQQRHNQLTETLMNKNVVDGIIASIFFTVLSTVLGLILQAFGFSTQRSVIAAVFALFALLILFVVVRKYCNRTTQLLSFLIKSHVKIISKKLHATRKKSKY